MKRRDWSRDQLILVFNLYCKTPFGRLHARNPDVIELARLIGRTPDAVAWKSVNFAALDPALQKRHISGASHGSKADQVVWDEFNHDWGRLAFESENLRVKLANRSLAEILKEDSEFPTGKERETLVRIRVNQSFFRSAVLAAYDNKCCITGLAIPELLNASHIVPWSADVKNRVNPRNGLCLNALHDRMFDRGLMTITSNLKVKVSKQLTHSKTLGTITESVLSHHEQPIRLPERFGPEPEFLEYHKKNVFRD